MKIKNSPYNLRESLGYLKRNFFGPVSKNRGLVDYCQQKCILDDPVLPQYRIAFVGDIMDMAGRRLQIGEGLKQFIGNCDCLIGNFEATITTAKGAYMAQRHIPQILDTLADLFPPKKTYLGMANNHSGDFGFEIWSDSKQQVEEKGFKVLGTSEIPYIDLDDIVRVVGATQWSNQPVDYIVKIEDVLHYQQQGMFCILYPHWGYELELFPRPATVKKGKELSKYFDAIIGHHSHIPQPITKVSVEKPGGPSNQLIAYGLGDFCIHEKLKHYHYGQVIIMTIGRNEGGLWRSGSLDWKFLHCRPINEDVWETDITDHFPYLTEW